jgi:hypothetical protein
MIVQEIFDVLPTIDRSRETNVKTFRNVLEELSGLHIICNIRRFTARDPVTRFPEMSSDRRVVDDPSCGRGFTHSRGTSDCDMFFDLGLLENFVNGLLKEFIPSIDLDRSW